MEKLEKEKKFDELIKKFSWFDLHVNNLADAMMYVAMVGHTFDANGNSVEPTWKIDVLTGLAMARADLQELYELHADSKNESAQSIKEHNKDSARPVMDHLQQEIMATNSRFGEILNALCSREVIDDGATLEWMRKSIADARILLDRLSDDSSSD